MALGTGGKETELKERRGKGRQEERGGERREGGSSVGFNMTGVVACFLS